MVHRGGQHALSCQGPTKGVHPIEGAGGREANAAPTHPPTFDAPVTLPISSEMTSTTVPPRMTCVAWLRSATGNQERARGGAGGGAWVGGTGAAASAIAALSPPPAPLLAPLLPLPLTRGDDRVGLLQRRLHAHNHSLLAVVPAGLEQPATDGSMVCVAMSRPASSGDGGGGGCCGGPSRAEAGYRPRRAAGPALLGCNQRPPPSSAHRWQNPLICLALYSMSALISMRRRR